MVAFQLQKHNIQALIIIGGFEGFTSVLQLVEARNHYPQFCIPIIQIPATISNNVPGTEFSLGSDTALNTIIEACDLIKQSASSSSKRVFVIETMGGKCGYLTTLAGLGGGASQIYIPEKGVRISELAEEVQVRGFFLCFSFIFLLSCFLAFLLLFFFLPCSSQPKSYLIQLLAKKFSSNQREGRIILRNEECSSAYSTEFFTNLFNEEGNALGLFDCRSVNLGVRIVFQIDNLSRP